MKVYVVNLPKDISRREHMERQLRQAGISDYEIVPGVVASEMSPEELKAGFDFDRAAKNRLGCPTMPEIGCAIAHWRVWKMISESGQSGLVLEDDVILKPGFKKWAESITLQMPENDSWVVVTSVDPVVKKNFAITPLGLYRAYICWGTLCYIMSNKSAEILSQSRPFTIADDWQRCRKIGVTVYSGFDFPVCLDTVFESGIDGSRSSERLLPLHVKIIKSLKLWQVYERLWLRLHGCLRKNYNI